MKVTYIEKGPEYNYKRFGDHEVTIYLFKVWRSGGILYGYKDRFNTVAISLEDIISIEQ